MVATFKKIQLGILKLRLYVDSKSHDIVRAEEFPLDLVSFECHQVVFPSSGVEKISYKERRNDKREGQASEASRFIVSKAR